MQGSLLVFRFFFAGSLELELDDEEDDDEDDEEEEDFFFFFFPFFFLSCGRHVLKFEWEDDAR